MGYLCLVHRPPTDRRAEAAGAARATVHDDLRRMGQLLDAAALEPAEGVLVRVRAGDLSIAPAPATAGGELDAFFILEARDLNDAIQLAARDPGARHGTIEVRPFRSDR